MMEEDAVRLGHNRGVVAEKLEGGDAKPFKHLEAVTRRFWEGKVGTAEPV